MIAARRAHRRPYFFEIFTALNLAVILVLAGVGGAHILASLPGTLILLVVNLGSFAIAGIVIRIVAAAIQGTLRDYLAILRSPGWLTDTVRLVLLGSLLSHTYAWIKLLVPVLHPVLYDQQLWDLDQMLLFGLSPNILLLNLFDYPPAIAVIDWSYARIFLVSMTVTFGFFLSHPSRRLRVAFNDCNTVMWLAGAWLYMLIPSVGPAFRFPDVWMPLAAMFPITQQTQAMLMRNYQNLLRFAAGQPVELVIFYGVAAFPSMHVAFQTFAFLWMRRIWIYGQIVFGIFVITVFLGSVITGWHYLIDGVAGIALAALCYWGTARAWRIPRWLRLQGILRRRA